MAIRRPSVYRRNEFVFQDFLYHSEGLTELRYILCKYDGANFELVAQTFDTASPDLKGGNVIARLDYTVSGKLITIDHWELNWRDEWPLRLSVQYLLNCLYSPGKGYSVRVAKDAYAFWVSENLFPLSNEPDDYLTQL
jgi:hypothetical protein